LEEKIDIGINAVIINEPLISRGARRPARTPETDADNVEHHLILAMPQSE